MHDARHPGRIASDAPTIQVKAIGIRMKRLPHVSYETTKIRSRAGRLFERTSNPRPGVQQDKPIRQAAELLRHLSKRKRDVALSGHDNDRPGGRSIVTERQLIADFDVVGGPADK